MMSSNKYAVKTVCFFSILLFVFLANPVSAQGKKNGKVTTKYPNGVKESSGKVKNHKKEGEWKYYSEDGKLWKAIHYKQDVMEGLYTEYYSTGQKEMEGNYSGGRKDGPWNSWYTDGKPSSKLNYDGKKFIDEMNSSYEGLQQWFYENGQLREQASYSNMKIAYRLTYYHNGKRKAVENYRNGLKNGEWRRYDEEATDTLPAYLDHYVDGKKEGVHKAYKSGMLAEEFYYKNDVYDGTIKTWDNNGNLGVEENYVDGLREGLCKYFNYGRCIREATYHKGKLDGEEKEYTGKSELFRESWYRNGNPDSVFTFHPNGKLATERRYKYIIGFVSTEEFSEYKEWSPEGKLLLKGSYHFEQKDHDWTTYYPDKKIKSVTPYSNGQMNGIYKKWYANGKEMIEYRLERSYAADQPKVWDVKGKLLKPGTKAYDEIVDGNLPGEIYNDPKQVEHDRIHFVTPEIEEAEVPQGVVQEPPFTDLNVTQEEPIFQIVEVMPEFPGGNGELNKFMAANIKYPQQYKEAGQQGTVYLKFVVERDGSVTNVEVLKGVTACPLFDKEAVRVVSMLPEFSPGKMNGRTVRCYYQLPVRFVMQ